MKSYAIRWESESSSGTDFIVSDLPSADVYQYYYKEQHWLTILSIDEICRSACILTRSADGKFLLNGEE